MKTVTEAEHMKNKNGGIDFRNKYTFVKNLHISIVFVTIFILEIMLIFGNIILAAQCWNFDFFLNKDLGAICNTNRSICNKN